MKKIMFLSIMLFLIFLVAFTPVFAESLGGVSLGDNIKKANSQWGTPKTQTHEGNGKIRYIWEKGSYRMEALAKHDSLIYIRASTCIGSNTPIKETETSKGIHLGGKAEDIVKKYGEGNNDYSYPSEDCWVPSYHTGKNQVLVFRIYGFGDGGAEIIDIILCRPDYPKNMMWGN